MSSQKKITCFGSTGKHFQNNTKCPNSDSCCQTVDQCRPDRLCVSNNDDDTLVRAPCSVNPWSDNCAKVCIEEDSSGFLPRVNICKDGSYCCVKDPTCCVDKRGFFLNDDGTIKARANETIPETSSSIIMSTTAATNPTAPTETTTDTTGGVPEGPTAGAPAATTSPEIPQPASPGISKGAKFGIGFGVAFGVVLIFIALFFWRNRQRRKRLQVNPAAYPTYGQTNKMGEVPVELPTPQHVTVSELDGYYSQGSRK